LRICGPRVGLALAIATVISGCAREYGNGAGSSLPTGVAAAGSRPKTTRIEAGPDAPRQAQTALIKAKPGEVIEFGPGNFEFTATLSLDVSQVTLRGQGSDKTTLSFRDQGQGTGGEGLLITSKSRVTVEELGVLDAKGDAIKINGTSGLILRNLRADWSGGPKETNGGYGIYPVNCTGVLIEGCTVRGASDAGIYVGQSENIIVRRNTVQQNVAGIEIENCIRADVYENTATDNAGGVLVFTLPDLPKKDGRHCRVHHNSVKANNHENFAPKGNIVATVPAGTGVMIMASDDVEVFDNDIENNQTAGLSIVSYLLTEKPMSDDKYDPFCESIHIHHNRFKDNGRKPGGTIGQLVAHAVGTPLPDMLYDGMLNPSKAKNGVLPAELALHIHDNGDAGFVNFDAAGIKAAAAAAGAGEGKAPALIRDLKLYAGELPALAPVAIEGIK
jgi:parallel beta-helix repeat protein